jgi:hypothetical protein
VVAAIVAVTLIVAADPRAVALAAEVMLQSLMVAAVAVTQAVVVAVMLAVVVAVMLAAVAVVMPVAADTAAVVAVVTTRAQRAETRGGNNENCFRRVFFGSRERKMGTGWEFSSYESLGPSVS